MSKTKRDYARTCDRLLKAETEAEVAAILTECGMMDPRHWKLLGDMLGDSRRIGVDSDLLLAELEVCVSALLIAE